MKAGDIVKVNYIGVLRRKEPRPAGEVELCDINADWRMVGDREGGKVVIRPFDSSRSIGRKPIKFAAGAEPRQVVRGFDECLLAMRLGDSGILHIRSDYAYGERGCPPRAGAPLKDPGIPGSTDIVFHIELLAVNGEDSSSEAAIAAQAAAEKEQARQQAEDSFLEGLAVPTPSAGKSAGGKKKGKGGSKKKKK